MNGIAILPAIAALGLLATTDTAQTRRMAVLIVPLAPEDGELAENLSEVALSQLADRGRGEMVGTRELRRFLERDENGPGAVGCARDAGCLRRLGAALNLDRIVAGTVRRLEPGFVLEVALIDAASGRAEKRLERVVNAGVDSLIQAAQDAVEALFAETPSPAPPPLTPVPSLRLDPASPNPRIVAVERWPDHPRRRWAPHVAYGSAAVAGLSFVSAGIFGTLANADPAGPTRAAAQRDLQLRDDYATTANVFLLAGTVLTAVSIAVFVLLRRDVTGD
jgi:hypothetical protein